MLHKLALINGNVITVDDRRPRASAVFAVNDLIVKVGSNGEVQKLIDDETEVIDLGGKTLVPGFVDCHAHPMDFGQSLMIVNCRTPPLKSIEDLGKAVREDAAAKGEGDWVIGAGYDDFKLAEKRNPNRWDLDRAAPRNPVIITRLCGHVSVVNSLALRLAGITRDTPDKDGEEIDRDPETREPTGVLRGGASGPVWSVIPPRSIEDLRKGIKLAAEAFIARGVTSVSEAGVDNSRMMKAYSSAIAEGLPVRVNLMMYRSLLGELSKLGLETGFGDNRLQIGAIKMVFDGSFSGRTAAMFNPFKDSPGNLGILYMSQEELDKGVQEAHEAGFQVGVHAIGDRAIMGVLDAYEEALRKRPKKDHRFRIEHCGINSPEIVERIRDLGVIPVPQPIFLYGEGESYRAGLEEENHKWAYPAKAWFDAGINVAFSSDCPATSGEEVISPLLGIYVAATRKTDAGVELGSEQRIDPEEAIKAYTLGGAYATFSEKVKGSIEPGKLADFSLLSGDPTAVEVDIIKDLRVLLTIIGGRVVFRLNK